MNTRAGERESPHLRVLIADDEPRARQFLEKLLGEHDEVEVVGAARGGAEALQMIADLKPNVAFLDIHMPDLSGLEVARHLKGDDAPTHLTVVESSSPGAHEARSSSAILRQRSAP